MKTLFTFLISILASCLSQSESKVKPKFDSEAIFVSLMNRNVEARVTAANGLARIGYEDLKNFDFRNTECGKLKEGYDIFKVKCKYMNHAVYHLIGNFSRLAKFEMDPKSKYFCQKGYEIADCPFLSKLRWLVFNQFENPLIDEPELSASDKKKVSPARLQKMAFDALKKVTHIKAKNTKELEVFHPKKANEGDHQWVYLELGTGSGVYAAPVVNIYKADTSGKILFEIRLLPFDKKSGAYDYSSEPRSVRFVDDLQIYLKTEIAVLRVNQECCGDDRIHFHFMDVKNNWKKIAIVSVTIPSKLRGASKDIRTIDLMQKIFIDGPPKYPIITKSGSSFWKTKKSPLQLRRYRRF